MTAREISDHAPRELTAHDRWQMRRAAERQERKRDWLGCIAYAAALAIVLKAMGAL